MARIITTENPSLDVRRYLRHWANTEFVAERLRAKHPGLSAHRRRTKSQQIAVFVAQGLEFLESAVASAVLTKPLALFYAAESLAKAACMFRIETADATAFATHGIGGERATKRYSTKNLACRVYKPGRDVWSQFFGQFNSDRARISFVSEGKTFTRDWVNTHPTKPLLKDSPLQFGELVKHLPEVADDVIFAGWGNAYVVHASTLLMKERAGPPAVQELDIVLRHGHHAETKAMVTGSERGLLKMFTRHRDEFDVVEYRSGPVEVGKLTGPVVRLDVLGEPYMDFARGRRVFGEPVLYFAGLFILSDVVRYQPEQWLRLLNDHPAEAILIERFLDVAVRKLPNLILNELSEELVLFKFAR